MLEISCMELNVILNESCSKEEVMRVAFSESVINFMTSFVSSIKESFRFQVSLKELIITALVNQNWSFRPAVGSDKVTRVISMSCFNRTEIVLESILTKFCK